MEPSSSPEAQEPSEPLPHLPCTIADITALPDEGETAVPPSLDSESFEGASADQLHSHVAYLDLMDQLRSQAYERMKRFKWLSEELIDLFQENRWESVGEVKAIVRAVRANLEEVDESLEALHVERI